MTQPHLCSRIRTIPLILEISESYHVVILTELAGQDSNALVRVFSMTHSIIITENLTEAINMLRQTAKNCGIRKCLVDTTPIIVASARGYFVFARTTPGGVRTLKEADHSNTSRRKLATVGVTLHN